MVHAPSLKKPQQTEVKGDGTELSGYVTPDLGPFECGNCIHYEGDEQQGSCNHPVVQADPEVEGGQVQAEACCNYFRSAHKETQEEEHGEDAANSQRPEDNGLDEQNLQVS